jgi:molybdopterin-guanine dinucleotide biosynthesis protein A
MTPAWDAAVVLAGGGSTRMRSEKALLDAGGRSLVEQHLLVLAPRFREVAVSVGAGGPSPGLERAIAAAGAAAGCTFAAIRDRELGRGPLAGVAAALAALAAPRAFFVAVDMVEVRFDLVAALWDRASAPGARGCVPRWGHGLEPAFAVYGRDLLGDLERILGQGAPGLKALAKLPGVGALDLEDPLTRGSVFRDAQPDLTKLFLNVNSVEDYRRWRQQVDPGPRKTFR